MHCPLCEHGEVRSGVTTLTLERDRTTLVLKRVPAAVCATCGEAYVDEHIASVALDLLEQAVRAGVYVDVRDFDAAGQPGPPVTTSAGA
jgi:YgiT-type zinc finger domain-containing protein